MRNGRVVRTTVPILSLSVEDWLLSVSVGSSQSGELFMKSSGFLTHDGGLDLLHLLVLLSLLTLLSLLVLLVLLHLLVLLVLLSLTGLLHLLVGLGVVGGEAMTTGARRAAK